MPSFRTKRGRCHVEDGTLRLESSLRGQLRRYREGGTITYVSYLVVMVAAVAVLVANLLDGDLRAIGLWGGVAAVVLAVGYGVNYLRGFTSDDEIPLDAIDHVTAVEGTVGLTRPRFVVTYERDGETRHRYVMMPSKWLSYGEAEFRLAKERFREAGIPIEEE